MDRRSPTEHGSPRELQRTLAAEREGIPLLVYRDDSDELVVRPLLEVEAPVTVGRGAEVDGARERLEVDVRLAWDPQVSQLHAELQPLGGEWLVVDDGLSRNGTFVSDERVAGRRRLRDGDLVRCGATLLLYRHPGAEATRGETAIASDAAPELTPAQRRVLVALCRPLSEGTTIASPATNREIAAELFLTVDAVKAHLRGLFERFQIGELPQNQKRIALAERAFRTGAVGPRDLRGS